MDSVKIKSKLITQLRNNIDEIDTEIIELLSSRLEKARQIIKIKDELGESAFSPDREREILNNLFQKSSRLLNKTFIESVYELIFDESKSISKKRENPYSLTFYISDAKSLRKFNQLPNFLTADFDFILSYDDPSFDIKKDIRDKKNIKFMFYADSYESLNLLNDTPEFIVPNYFHNFCDESQKRYANYANENNSTLVLRYGNGFYLKEFIGVLDKYLSILDSPPAILAEKNAQYPIDNGNEINLESLLTTKPYSTATLFKDACYLSRETEIVNVAKSSYAGGADSVIIDIDNLTNASTQTIIEFCQVLSKL